MVGLQAWWSKVNFNRAPGKFSNTTSPFWATSTEACNTPDVGLAAGFTGRAGAGFETGALELAAGLGRAGCAGTAGGAWSFFAKSGFGGITSGFAKSGLGGITSGVAGVLGAGAATGAGATWTVEVACARVE
jgi:hypothetical protein